MACCSSATWHVALMPVPPDGCDDSGVFLCGARLHAERFLTGDSTTTMLLLPSAARGTHAGASRRLRRQRRLRLWGSASCRAAFDRGSTTCWSSTRHAALMPVPPDGCEDSGVFVGITPSGFRPGQHLELCLGNAARGTHASASRRLRRRQRRLLLLRGSAAHRPAFDHAARAAGHQRGTRH